MLTLDRALRDEIVQHGLREFPNEACGLLAGVDGRPVRAFPMRNADASPVTYRLDPKEQLAVFEEIEANGWELVGIFHTHTHSEAYPSETDRRQAFYPEASYVLVSLQDREAPVLRSFRIVDGQATEEEVVVTEATAQDEMRVG